MQAWMVVPTFTDAELLARHYRRRRWMIRICISLVLILLILTALGFVVLNPSGMSADEAAVAFTQLTHDDTRVRAEHFLVLLR